MLEELWDGEDGCCCGRHLWRECASAEVLRSGCFVGFVLGGGKEVWSLGVVCALVVL